MAAVSAGHAELFHNGIQSIFHTAICDKFALNPAYENEIIVSEKLGQFSDTFRVNCFNDGDDDPAKTFSDKFDRKKKSWVLLVFDVSDKSYFEKIQPMLEKFKEFSASCYFRIYFIVNSPGQIPILDTFAATKLIAEFKALKASVTMVLFAEESQASNQRMFLELAKQYPARVETPLIITKKSNKTEQWTQTQKIIIGTAVSALVLSTYVALAPDNPLATAAMSTSDLFLDTAKTVSSLSVPDIESFAKFVDSQEAILERVATVVAGTAVSDAASELSGVVANIASETTESVSEFAKILYSACKNKLTVFSGIIQPPSLEVNVDFFKVDLLFKDTFKNSVQGTGQAVSPAVTTIIEHLKQVQVSGSAVVSILKTIVPAYQNNDPRIYVGEVMTALKKTIEDKKRTLTGVTPPLRESSLIRCRRLLQFCAELEKDPFALNACMREQIIRVDNLEAFGRSLKQIYGPYYKLALLEKPAEVMTCFEQSATTSEAVNAIVAEKLTAVNARVAEKITAWKESAKSMSIVLVNALKAFRALSRTVDLPIFFVEKAKRQANWSIDTLIAYFEDVSKRFDEFYTENAKTSVSEEDKDLNQLKSDTQGMYEFFVSEMNFTTAGNITDLPTSASEFIMNIRTLTKIVGVDGFSIGGSVFTKIPVFPEPTVKLGKHIILNSSDSTVGQ